MKKLTGAAIINTAEGKRIAFTYSNIDESTGKLIQDNKKESFIALDSEFLENIKAVEDYIINNKLQEGE